MTVTEDTPFSHEDDTYHRASDDPFWMETTWWSFNVPERRTGGWLHAGYNTNRGTVTWKVFVWDPSGADPGRLAYYKIAPEVPMPPDADLRDIAFPQGGFSVKMLTPLTDYHISYDDHDAGFAIDMRTLGFQDFDVAVECTQRHAGRLGEHRAADRMAVAPQHLNEVQETLRA